MITEPTRTVIGVINDSTVTPGPARMYPCPAEGMFRCTSTDTTSGPPESAPHTPDPAAVAAGRPSRHGDFRVESVVAPGPPRSPALSESSKAICRLRRVTVESAACRPMRLNGSPWSRPRADLAGSHGTSPALQHPGHWHWHAPTGHTLSSFQGRGRGDPAMNARPCSGLTGPGPTGPTVSGTAARRPP